MSLAVTDDRRGKQHESAVAAVANAAENRGPRLPEQIPYRQPYMRLNHTEVVSADELETIHEASLQILERIGMEFIDPESRSIIREAGADVDEPTDPRALPTRVHRAVDLDGTRRVHAAQLEPGPRTCASAAGG